PAGADHQHPRRQQLLLPLLADLVEDQVPGVALELLFAQFHRALSCTRLLRFARNDTKTSCHCEEPTGATKQSRRIWGSYSPSILCAPGGPPDRTALSSGSTATIFSPGLRAFSTEPTPVSVPPVPTPLTTTSTRPPVSRQISSAVVRRWISGLAGFWNCCGMNASGRLFTISSARAIAPRMPCAAGVSSSSAPSSSSILRRSSDMLSGIVRISR